MCMTPSCCVTKNKIVLSDPYIHSHSELTELHGVDDDSVAKYEWSLETFEIIIDHEPDWVKQSHRNAAEKHFKKYFDTRAKVVKFFGNLPEPWKLTEFKALYLMSKDPEKLPRCPCPCLRPCPCPNPCPCQRPCPYLSQKEYQDWMTQWMKTWVILNS